MGGTDRELSVVKEAEMEQKGAEWRWGKRMVYIESTGGVSVAEESVDQCGWEAGCSGARCQGL